METNVNAHVKTARFAGLLYFIWTLSGLFGLFYIPAHIKMSGAVDEIAQSLRSNELLFRMGIINDLFSNVIWIVMGLVFYRLFKHVSERQAKLLVAFVIVQIPATFFMGAFNITSLMIIKGEILKTFELTQRQDLGVLFLRMGDYGTLLLETFWGLWLFPLAILVYKSRFLPRFLGVWLTITGFFYLALSFISIVFPEYKNMVFQSPFALPAEVGEVALMLWLLIRGVRQKPVADN